MSPTTWRGMNHVSFEWLFGDSQSAPVPLIIGCAAAMTLSDAARERETHESREYFVYQCVNCGVKMILHWRPAPSDFFPHPSGDGYVFSFCSLLPSSCLLLSSYLLSPTSSLLAPLASSRLLSPPHASLPHARFLRDSPYTAATLGVDQSVGPGSAAVRPDQKLAVKPKFQSKIHGCL